VKHESLILSTKDHALINISEAKEHSTNNGFLCEEKQAIQTSNDISEAHEAFYKAILKRYVKCKEHSINQPRNFPN
jgi:hypothetical protein